MINPKNLNLMRWAFLLGPQYFLGPKSIKALNIKGKLATRRLISVDLDPYEMTERFVEEGGDKPANKSVSPVSPKEISDTFNTYLDQPAGKAPSHNDFRSGTADSLFESLKSLLDQEFSVKVPFPTGEVNARLKLEYFTDPERLADLFSKPHLLYWYLRKIISPVQREADLSSAERQRLDQTVEEVGSNLATEMMNPESDLVRRMVNRISKAVRHTAQFLGPLSAVDQGDKGKILDRVKPLAEDLVSGSLDNIKEKLVNKKELRDIQAFLDSLKSGTNVVRHYTEALSGQKKASSFLPQVIQEAFVQVLDSPEGAPTIEKGDSQSDWAAKVESFIAAVREEVFQRLLNGISAIRQSDEKDIAQEDDWVRKFLDQISTYVLEKSGIVPWKAESSEGYEHMFDALGYLFGEIKWKLRDYRDKFRGSDEVGDTSIETPSGTGEGTLGQMLEAPDVAQSGVGSALDELLAFFPVWFLGAQDGMLEVVSGVGQETLSQFKQLVGEGEIPSPAELIKTRPDILERLKVLVRWGLLGGKNGTGLSYTEVFAPPPDSNDVEQGSWQELKNGEKSEIVRMINPDELSRPKSQAMLSSALKEDLPKYFVRFVRYLMSDLDKFQHILEKGGSDEATQEIQRLVEGLEEGQRTTKVPNKRLQEELGEYRQNIQSALRLALHLPQLGHAMAAYLDNPQGWETGERFAGQALFSLWFRKQISNLGR